MYDHKSIESKWQKRWEESGIFHAKDRGGEKFYALVEFPYPSGEGLHLGHPRSYTAMDIIARKRRMEGRNVLFPIGWDAFGLPAENYAVKKGEHPRKTTAANIVTMRRQLQSLGFSFDWSREVNTTDSEYYKWTQWIFLQFFKHGLAYKAKMPINWCPSCKIGLANEEVVDGRCERCGGETEKRDKEQWMLKITAYADKLLKGLQTVDYIPRARVQQENWIGRSEGATIEFKIQNSKFKIPVFTTRADTLFGATYLVLAPEHTMVAELSETASNRAEIEAYVASARRKTDIERTAEGKEKTGVQIQGVMAENPGTKETIPVWIADYVLAHYGTGAIMAVPAHDERDWKFALKFNLAIRHVIEQTNVRDYRKYFYFEFAFISDDDPDHIRAISYAYQQAKKGVELGHFAYTGPGVLINSGQFDGMGSEEAKDAITKYVGGKKTISYKLRDWVFSRQRYWGEPIPIVFCGHCGTVPVPEKELPVKLPEVPKYEPTDTGESPLAAIADFVNTTCPSCGGAAKRETDVMPNWAGSSWYFLRYCDPENDHAFADPKKLKYWMPVDWYNGGMEHTTLHLLYSRFWNLFLHDIGAVPVAEPYAKRTSHGMILGQDGEKMSKSRGNVVNPDLIIEKYGADTLRCYEMFLGPFDQAAPWNSRGIIGVRRFLDKAWYYVERWHDGETRDADARLIAKTIKKASDDIECMRFNTAIAALMELFNGLGPAIAKADLVRIVGLISPFAPHLAEELSERLGNTDFVARAPWPTYDQALTLDEETDLVVQINGKVRDTLRVPAGLSDEDAKTRALGSSKVQSWIVGKEIKRVLVVKGRLVSIVIK